MTPMQVFENALARVRETEKAVEDAKQELRAEERELTSRRNTLREAKKKLFEAYPELVNDDA
jgi:hypothetical protein